MPFLHLLHGEVFIKADRMQMGLDIFVFFFLLFSSLKNLLTYFSTFHHRRQEQGTLNCIIW